MDDSSSTLTGPEADPPPDPNTDPPSTTNTSKGDRSLDIVTSPDQG